MDRGMEMGEVGMVEPVASLPGPSGLKNVPALLEHFINSNSLENGSDTPDFILGGFLADVLAAYDKAVTNREKWYGRKVGLGAAIDSARSAPEPAPGEGSPSPSEIEDFQADLWAALLNTSAKITPSHTWEKWMKIKRAIPSGPSQDSQEVAEAIETLRGFAKRWCDDGQCRNINGYSHDPECRDFYNAIDAVEAALSQSPKGAAGPDRALAMETLLVLACKELIRRTGNIESQGCRAWWQGKEEGLEGGGDGEPSAPKTGLREPSAQEYRDLVHGEIIEATDEVWAYGKGPWAPVLPDVIGTPYIAYVPGIPRAHHATRRRIEAAQPPLSAAKGPDLPPSSQPAPGDVGEAGGVA